MSRETRKERRGYITNHRRCLLQPSGVVTAAFGQSGPVTFNAALFSLPRGIHRATPFGAARGPIGNRVRRDCRSAPHSTPSRLFRQIRLMVAMIPNMKSETSLARESRLLCRITRSSNGISTGEAATEARSRGDCTDSICRVRIRRSSRAAPSSSRPKQVGGDSRRSRSTARLLQGRIWRRSSRAARLALLFDVRFERRNLFVTPDPIDPKAPFSDSWKGFSGQAIRDLRCRWRHFGKV